MPFRAWGFSKHGMVDIICGFFKHSSEELINLTERGACMV